VSTTAFGQIPWHRRARGFNQGIVVRHAPGDIQPGFVKLFDGKTLAGWTVMGNPEGWQVVNGVIRSEAGKGGNWLRTNRTYSDFVLRLEWRVSQNGNSGVFIRCKENGNPWETGHEVQITNEPRDDLHCTGSLYGTVAVNPRPDESFGRWHTFEIRCEGQRIQVIADGVRCVDADMSRDVAIRDKPLAGYIGLQDAHTRPGGWIEFRNIRLKELPSVQRHP
jgi:hypothetical protein